MVLSTYSFPTLLFLGIILLLQLLKWQIAYLSKSTEKKIVSLKEVLKEKEQQQQVIYNLSTSIFLLRDMQKIISSTISEIVVMYHWSNVAYFPYGVKDMEKSFYGQLPQYSPLEVNDLIEKRRKEEVWYGEKYGEYVSIFLVGQPDNPLGGLYVGKTNSVLTESQRDFFKIVANFLTIAINNIQLSKEE